MRGMLVVIEYDSNIQSFSLKNLEKSWNSEEYLNRSLSNAVSFKGDIIVGDFEGYMHVIDPLNGRTIGRKKISKHPIKSIFSRSNRLYVVDESLNLYSISL